MQSIFVKPATGGRVRMPERKSQVMPESGAWVPRIDYYERLLISGCVAICDPPTAPAVEKKPAGTKEDSPVDPT